ncbi:alpha/beta hydrolase [Nocardioides seonyuensis]|uniref:Alpha/beta hydrolase n=1 Tax=Nocardioides seonyuensis TaxID=2518371 RepID=A0A4P7IDF0_9ACTN|nr:alpha/beta hydrolase [Nocardioides seonyuensis]QBX54700.1 alpha/beta hydrolase [Nocardioides seonyuensis]
MSELDPRLDPQLAGLLALVQGSGAPRMHEVTPDEARAMFRAMTVDFRDHSRVPQLESVTEATVPGGDGERPARIYRPRAGDLPTVVFFHGGGWVIGDLDTHDLTCRTIASLCDAVVLSVDYRLAPEHPFPAAVEDALAATRWAADHTAELGGSDVLAVAGDSAGGNLSAVVAQERRDAGERLDAQLLIYPGTDMLAELPSRTENAEGYFLDMPTMTWFAVNYLGAETDPAQPRLSPLRGDLAGVAPAVVVVAQFDPLRDEGTAYAEALAAAEVPVLVEEFDGLIHGFVDMGQHSVAAQQAIEETCRLFRALLHPADSGAEE